MAVNTTAAQNSRAAKRGSEKCPQGSASTALCNQYQPVRMKVPASAPRFNHSAKSPDLVSLAGSQETMNNAPEARANRAAFAPGP